MVLHKGGNANEMSAILHVMLELNQLKEFFIKNFFMDVSNPKAAMIKMIMKPLSNEIRNVFMSVFSTQLTICPLQKMNISDMSI